MGTQTAGCMSHSQLAPPAHLLRGAWPLLLSLKKLPLFLPIGVPSKLFGTNGLSAYYVPGTPLGSGEIQW